VAIGGLGRQNQASGAVDLHGDDHRPGLVEQLAGDRIADPALGIGSAMVEASSAARTRSSSHCFS
jgi:hypothetical protein